MAVTRNATDPGVVAEVRRLPNDTLVAMAFDESPIYPWWAEAAGTEIGRRLVRKVAEARGLRVIQQEGN